MKPGGQQLTGPLTFTSTNQIQPNNADDDPADDESSIVSELKTPTSVVQNSYMTPSNNIVSHTLRKNQQHATLQLQNNPSQGPAHVPSGFGMQAHHQHMNAPQ